MKPVICTSFSLALWCALAGSHADRARAGVPQPGSVPAGASAKPSASSTAASPPARPAQPAAAGPGAASPSPPANPAPSGAGTTPAAFAPVAKRLRVAIDEFKVQGEDVPPALVLQLQDGFVIGLVREGIQVVDPDDVSRRLQSQPELVGCATSPCLKRQGQLLDVRFMMRVKVDAVGNSYKMTARLFSTEGSAPAALPVDTQSRFCDVCTVTEARETMIRLADAIKVPAEEAPPVVAVVPPPPARSRALPLVALVASVAALTAGVVVLSAIHDSAKTAGAAGGALLGAGGLGALLSLSAMVDAGPRATPVALIGVHGTF